MNYRLLLPLCAVLLTTLGGCGSDPAASAKPAKPGAHAEGDGHDHGAAAEAPANRIGVPANVRQNLGITFAKAQYRVVEGVLRIPGRFEADAGARHEYPMPLAGAVTVLAKPYERVEPGAPLYRVAGQAWAQFRAQWHEAHSAAAAGDATAIRRRDLLAATLAQMLGRPVAEAQAHELCDAAEFVVHARSGGVIEPDVVSSGRVLEQNAAVLASTDPRRLRLRAIALQADLARLKEGQTCRIVPLVDSHTDAIPADFRLALEADPEHRTVDVVAWAKDGKDLPRWARPGLAALLEVVTDGGAEEVAIPVAGTIRDGLKTVLFRRDPANPDAVFKLDADLGPSDGAWVQVLSGVKEGDEVVTGGIYPLKLGSQGGDAPKGAHVHPDGTVHEGGH